MEQRPPNLSCSLLMPVPPGVSQLGTFLHLAVALGFALRSPSTRTNLLLCKGSIMTMWPGDRQPGRALGELFWKLVLLRCWLQFVEGAAGSRALCQLMTTFMEGSAPPLTVGHPNPVLSGLTNQPPIILCACFLPGFGLLLLTPTWGGEAQEREATDSALGLSWTCPLYLVSGPGTRWHSKPLIPQLTPAPLLWGWLPSEDHGHAAPRAELAPASLYSAMVSSMALLLDCAPSLLATALP